MFSILEISLTFLRVCVIFPYCSPAQSNPAPATRRFHNSSPLGRNSLEPRASALGKRANKTSATRPSECEGAPQTPKVRGSPRTSVRGIRRLFEFGLQPQRPYPQMPHSSRRCLSGPPARLRACVGFRVAATGARRAKQVLAQGVSPGKGPSRNFRGETEPREGAPPPPGKHDRINRWPRRNLSIVPSPTLCPHRKGWAPSLI
jgi:hypothetical protein